MSSIAALIEDIHLVAGVLMNILLLYAIRRYSRFGTYKYVLAIFASYDIFLTVVHGLTKPKVIIIEAIIGIVTVFKDRRICATYGGLFTVPFMLMNIHFLYRFWSIRHPNRIAWFSKKKFICFLIYLPMFGFVTWHLVATRLMSGEKFEDSTVLLADEYERRYGNRLTDGWLFLNFDEESGIRSYGIITMIIFDSVMIGSFSTATTLAALTYHHISKADQNISKQMINLQFKLLIAVCAQTFVPLVFVYIPYLGINHFAFLRLPGYGVDWACMQLTACFPAYDAVIMIVLIKDYREGLLSLLCKKKESATLNQTTTWNNVSTVSPLTESVNII